MHCNTVEKHNVAQPSNISIGLRDSVAPRKTAALAAVPINVPIMCTSTFCVKCQLSQVKHLQLYLGKVSIGMVKIVWSSTFAWKTAAGAAVSGAAVSGNVLAMHIATILCTSRFPNKINFSCSLGACLN